MADENIPAPPSGTAVPVIQDANTPPPPPSGTAVAVGQDPQPSTLDKLATPPSQEDFESAMQKGGAAPTMYGLKNVVAGAGQAVKGVVDLAKTTRDVQVHPIDTVKSILSGITGAGSQLSQAPAAVADIAKSADPTGSFAKVAGDTAGQLGGQTVAAAATEGARLLPSTLKTALSKGGVTSEMAGKISTSLDKVAADAGLPKSAETSLSGKAADTVKGLKGQAQDIYSDLDKASGGRYQRFVDEIDTIEDALRNKYTTAEDAVKLKKQLSQVKADYQAVQGQLVQQGVDPGVIAKADTKWAQAKALDQVGKKFRVAESLSGEVKPGTTSVDAGLKNLKKHILPQATKGEAGGITDAVTEATDRLSKVKRNQAIAKVGAAALGAGALAKGLTK